MTTCAEKNLEQLDLTEIQNAVACYRNLFYHRKVILEGVRKVAFRNMVHLSDAIAYRESTGDTTRNEQWVGRVQRKTLADQQLEDNEVNRELIGWATYYPVQVYLALLYAEVEFCRRFCANSAILADPALSVHLEAKTEFTSTLSRFRDFYLHPAAANAAAEGIFLGLEGSYNNAPELQHQMDEHLSRTRLGLQHELRDILFGLPDIERLVCISLFLNINLKRMEDYGDLEAMKNIVRQLDELNDQLGSVPEDIRSRPPSQKQQRAAQVLAGLMNEVSPSGPEQRFTDLDPTQTPMSPWPLMLLVPGKAPNSYGQSRTANHVRKNVEGLVRILFTAGVLLNEAATNLGSHTIEGLAAELAAVGSDRLANRLQEEVERGGLRYAQDVVSLNRVSTALLHEPLRLYADIARQQPEVSVSALDKWSTPVILAARGPV